MKHGSLRFAEVIKIMLIIGSRDCLWTKNIAHKLVFYLRPSTNIDFPTFLVSPLVWVFGLFFVRSHWIKWYWESPRTNIELEIASETQILVSGNRWALTADWWLMFWDVWWYLTIPDHIRIQESETLPRAVLRNLF